MSFWGLEKKQINFTNCPQCGAGCTFRDTFNGDYIYACGTQFNDRRLSSQTQLCVGRSFRVQQRAATIGGILQACEDNERTEVLNILKKQGLVA